MSGPAHLSASSLALWLSNRDRWVLRYLGGAKDVSTHAMGIGTRFDREIKAWLLKGTVGTSPEWGAYKALGGLQLLSELVGPVDCEVKLEKEVSGVPILGYADLIIGGLGVLDWKVNGMIGGASPSAGYILRYPGGGMHKNAVIGEHLGVKINVCKGYSPVWGIQMGTYSLLTGLDLSIIHQLTRRKEHVLTVHAWRNDDLSWLRDAYVACWDSIQRGHIYDELSIEESQRRVATMTRPDAGLYARVCVASL